MEMRPGALTGRRALHFFLLMDCSGSMAADGKMQALNTAVREMLPHLESVSAQNPHAQLLVRAIASTARAWITEPSEPGELRWQDLSAGGYTDLGRRRCDSSRPSPRFHATPLLPPAILLVSDGLSTDDGDAGLEALLATPWGAQAVRTSVAIGRDADLDGLRRSTSADDEPLSASNPEELVRCLRWASVHSAGLARAVLDRSERVRAGARRFLPAAS